MSGNIAAYLSAQKTIKSTKEMPLSILGEGLHVVPHHTFRDDDGNAAIVATRRFKSVEDIKTFLARTDIKVYVYKLYELQGYSRDLKLTGERFYHFRCCVRDRRD